MPTHPVELVPEAEEQFFSFDETLRFHIAAHLNKLREDPIGGSWPSSGELPYGYRATEVFYFDGPTPRGVAILFIVCDGGVIQVERFGLTEYFRGPWRDSVWLNPTPPTLLSAPTRLR